MPSEMLSASELERFCYCPLSWWLSREEETKSPSLQAGDKRHGDFSHELGRIVEGERRAMLWEKAVLLFSLVASILALMGILIFNQELGKDWIWVSTIPSILWIGLIMYLLYRTNALPRWPRLKWEQLGAIAGIIAVFIVLNAIIVLEIPEVLAMVCLILSLFWLAGTSVVLYLALETQRKAEITRNQVHLNGHVVYIGNDEAPAYRSERLGLTGKPDYILDEGDELVPVELKSGRRPKGPLFSHIVQVSAYCLLLRDLTDRKVSRGVLRYGDQEYDVEFDESLQELVLSKMEEMREVSRKGEAHRNHNRPGKCQSCSRRERCQERLA